MLYNNYYDVILLAQQGGCPQTLAKLVNTIVIMVAEAFMTVQLLNYGMVTYV